VSSFKARWFALAALVAIGAAPVAQAQARVVVLSEADERAYREAFDAVETNNWRGARAALARIDDESLAGVVRARIILSSRYRPSQAEANAWLREFGELSIADDVYNRARRLSRRARPPQPTYIPSRRPPGVAAPIADDTSQSRRQLARIAEAVGQGAFTQARALAETELAGPRSGQAHWWLGIVDFTERNYAGAAQHFEAASAWPNHNGWDYSGAHYWAARALLAAGQTHAVIAHLEAAASNPWNFYGQLAEIQLGRQSALDFTSPELDPQAAQHFIERYPSARRAAGLAQLGRLSEVEDELRQLHGRIRPEDDRDFLAFAIALDAPAAQLRAAEYSSPPLAAGYCPTLSFATTEELALDRALVLAVIRQESYFNPVAHSRTGARGLMQLLPSTANDLDRTYRFRRNPTKLYSPELNMQLGQDYLRWLMDEYHNDGDLARVFAAYNGGPGWLSRWLETQSDTSDPLLLLEMLPRAESRDYAERVLSHMALCRKALGQPTPELDSLASGEPARYTPLDARAMRVASR